jgi:negative regulator of sigma E activity
VLYVCGIPISGQAPHELLRLLARDEQAARDGTAFCLASALVHGHTSVALTPEMSRTLADALERERTSGFQSLALAARWHADRNRPHDAASGAVARTEAKAPLRGSASPNGQPMQV